MILPLDPSIRQVDLLSLISDLVWTVKLRWAPSTTSNPSLSLFLPLHNVHPCTSPSLQLRLTGLDSTLTQVSYIVKPTPFPGVTRDLRCSCSIITHSATFPSPLSFQQPALDRTLLATTHLEMKHTYNLYLVDTGFHPLIESSRSSPLVQSGSMLIPLFRVIFVDHFHNSVLIPCLSLTHLSTH